MTNFAESVVEEATLDWLRALDYNVLNAEDGLPGEFNALRRTYSEVVFPYVLHGAIARLNPELPAEAVDDACRKLLLSDVPVLAALNHRAHSMLVEVSRWSTAARTAPLRAPRRECWISIRRTTTTGWP